jgi:hypothetical protein
MIEPELRKEQKNQGVDEKQTSEHTFHPEYTVKNEDSHEVGIDILIQFYGELWESILDRVTGKIDGHLFAISHNGYRFDVYRKYKPEGKRIFPPLRLIRT